MPLLLCPNDNGAMQTMRRAGVECDMCPTCRGVWLDRGELEKLLAGSSDEALQRGADQRLVVDLDPRRPRPGRRNRDDDDDDYRRRGKRPSIFDIFD